MAFLGQTEETDNLFPCMRLLDFIRDDKYGGSEKFMALKMMRLYLKRIRYEMGSQWSFSSVAVEFMRYVIHVYSTDTYFIEDTASLNHYIREKETVPTTLRLEPQWTCDLDYNCSYGTSIPRSYNQTPVTFEELVSTYPMMHRGGSWSPVNCTGPRTAFIIPFRDRQSHLWILLNNIIPFLQRQKVDFRIFLVEQAIPEVFNRAALLNVGYIEALKLEDFDCFIFHDVDLIPEDWCNLYRCTKSPRHLAVAIDKFDYRLPYIYYAGGALALHRSTVNLMNGFTNIMFGWGGEDDDTYYRFVRHNLHLDRYNNTVGRYKMLDHDRDQTNPEAARTSREARYHWKFSSYDGLSSIHYSLTYSILNTLLTHFYVKLYGPVTLQESNTYFKTKAQEYKRRLLADPIEKGKVIAVRRRLIEEKRRADRIAMHRKEIVKRRNGIF